MRRLGTQPLETPRLLLRRHEPDDASAIFANWASDPAAARFWSWEPHDGIDVTRAILAQWIRAYDSPEYYHWAIVLRPAMLPVGYIYLDSIDAGNGSAAVHFLLGSAFWDRGFATEACRAVIDFAFTGVGLTALHSRHHADNPASGRVLLKCGFTHTRSEYRSLVPDRISGLYHHYILHAESYKKR